MTKKSDAPAIRFKGFSDAWEQRKLGDMMNVTSVKRIHQSDWTDSGVRFLRARDIVAAAKNEEPDDYLYISKEKYEEYSALSGKVGVSDLLVTGVGTIGVPYLVRNLEPLYFKDGNIIWFQNSDKIDGKFLFYSFSAEQIQGFINESAGIGTVGTYTIESGKKTPISLPNQIEQAKVGEFFQQLDNLITLHQRKCVFLFGFFQAFISMIFTASTFSWEQRKLGDVVKEITRNDPESEAPIMMITANNGFIEQSERYAFNNAGESLKKYILLKKGELAYNHGASKLRPYGSCFALTTAENARIPFVYHCFSAENQNAEFMSIELNGAEIENQLRKIVSSGARMDGLLNISFDEYTSVSVILPGTEEQDRIADFFRHLDNLITLHQRKFEKLTNVKKSMLEKMFPQNGSSYPKIRFKGFTDPWEQRKLGDIADIVGGGTPSTGNQSYWDGDIDWYTPAEIADQIYANSSQKKITGLGYENSSAKMLSPGTVLFTSRAGIGKTAILTRKGCTNQGFQSIVPHRGELDSYFIFSRTEELKRYGELVGAGSTFVEVSGKQMAVMELMMPPTMREQQTIGGFFQQLDHLITLHQRKPFFIFSI